MRILVCAEIKDRVIFFEYMLGAVSVMDIEINNKDLLITDLLGISRAYGDIIEYAETHCPVRLGMMARRSDRTEGPVYLAFSASVDCLNNSACSEHRSLKGIPGNIGIGIKIAGKVLDLIEISLWYGLSGYLLHDASLGFTCMSLSQRSEFFRASIMRDSLWDDSGCPTGISCLRNMSSYIKPTFSFHFLDMSTQII